DVGQSTGGFTDCLLQHGAARVVGLDVGHGQLHPHLRADSRVVCLEGVNARHLQPGDIEEPNDFEVLVADVSFISLTLVLPALVALLHGGAHVLLLVKPQFELQPEQIGKGGIVKDATHYSVVELRLRTACALLGLQVKHWLPSPIEGGDGNREFFIHAFKTP
ncbi:MAG: TlyA family RNA methyltransferase, partial [Burkholderiaceae bacterium]